MRDPAGSSSPRPRTQTSTKRCEICGSKAVDVKEPLFLHGVYVGTFTVRKCLGVCKEEVFPHKAWKAAESLERALQRAQNQVQLDLKPSTPWEFPTGAESTPNLTSIVPSVSVSEEPIAGIAQSSSTAEAPRAVRPFGVAR